MASRDSQRVSAFAFSVLLHAAIVAGLTFSIPLSRQSNLAPESAPIEAVMIDGAALNAEIERRKQVEIERQQQEAADRRAREEADRRAREEADRRVREEADRIAREEADRRAREEADRLAREEADRLAREEADRLAREEADRLAREEADRLAREEADRLAREEADRLAREERERQLAAERAARERLDRIAEETALAIAAEQEAQRARESGVVEQWLRQVSNQIKQHWTKPPTARPGIECLLIMRMIPSGDVVSVSIDDRQCNADDAVRRSIENAVRAASPMPLPSVRAVFQSQIEVLFAPDE